MENKPQIPTLKESQNNEKKGAPLLKIKGLQSGLSLVERLKQFKKKDLAFILAGLGVLFMAPLAEHFMMSPNDQGGDGTMTPGFSSGKGGSSPFGSGSSPYEPGVSGLAPGGSVGSGSDVITPLNVRDPSALVMGPGATQQAPATTSQPSAAPPPPPPTKEDSKWNDAIAAGKAAASAATKKAALPVPKVPLSAGGLRGLGAVSGGSGSSFGLPPISSAGLGSSRPNQSNGLTGTNGSGFKGVARGPGTGGNTAGLEKLKQAAANAGGDFNRAGSATSALEAAASRDMGGGSGGGAGEGGGKDDKATSGSQNKDSKSPGESLEFLRQKMQMEKDIAFADELRKNDPSCLFDFGKPCMERNKIFAQGEETLINKGLVEPIAGVMADAIKGWLEPDSTGMVICISEDKKTSLGPIKKPSACGKGTKKDDPQGTYCLLAGNVLATQPATEYPGHLTCFGAGLDGGNSPDKKARDGADNVGPVTNGPVEKGGPLGDMCTSLAGLAKQGAGVTGAGPVGAAVKVDGKLILGYQDLVTASQQLASVKGWASGDLSDQGNCGGTGMTPKGLATADGAVKPRLDKNKAAIRKMIAGYKRDVLAADGTRVQAMETMEGQANNALNEKLTAVAKAPAEVDAVYQAAEQPFADAQKQFTEEQQADKDKWQPLATKVPIKNAQDELADIQKEMGEVTAGADSVKTLVTKARAEVATSDADTKAQVEKFAAPIEKSADYWKQTVAKGAYSDQWSNQSKALQQFNGSIDDPLKPAHTDAIALIGSQGGGNNGAAAPKDITPIGAGPVQTALPAAPANGGNAAGGDYRSQIASALSTYKSKIDAAQKADQAQAGSGDAIRNPAFEAVKTAVQKADASVNKSRDTYNRAASAAGNKVTGGIETELGGPIQPAEADGAAALAKPTNAGGQ